MTIVAVLTAVGLVAPAASMLVPRDDWQRQSEQTSSSKQAAFVCRLDGLTPQERVQQRDLRARLERGRTRVSEDDDGYTFHYITAVTPETVIAWVEMERKCCPFLRFTLDMAEQGGASRLRVWGAPGVKAFVATEMNLDK